MKEKSGSRTMLLSVLMSAPGPLVMGLGLLAGRSAAQVADFVRRSAELMALIVAYIVYLRTAEMPDEAQKAKLERGSNLFVGLSMCAGGLIMLLIALFAPNTREGSVIGGLIIAALGMVANSLFFVKYTRLSRQNGSSILAVQGRLYGAKTLVDTCVTIALAAVMFFPASAAAGWLDQIASVIVALYLAGCGVKTVFESRCGSRK